MSNGITMKKALMICLAIFLMFGVSIDAKAAAKAPSKEEVQLQQLIAYRDALVLQGASQADVDYANKAIALVQAQVAAQNGAAAQTAAQAQAQQAALAQQQAALAQQQAALAQQQAQAAALAQQQAALANMDKTLQKGFKRPAAGVIFVGDSRFVQMRDALNGYGAIIVAQGWMGHDWMMDTAIPEIDPALTKGCKVVINLGVNDLKNIDQYIADVNAQAAMWAARGVRTYYATVNPVEGNNYAVDEFNKKLINGLVGVTIIDTNSFMKLYGYRLVDNVHYDGQTNLNIYSYIMSQL